MSDKNKNIVVSIVFISILVIVLIINIFKSDTLISLSERRKLATLPSITLKNITDGSYFSSFEKYSMDQFFRRENFRTLKTFVELNLFNKKDSNDIYKYGNFLIKQEYPLNEKSIIYFSNKITNIQETYLDESNKVYYSVIPDKNYFIEGNSHLSFDYTRITDLLNNNLNNITYINIFDDLDLADYYYTDTHWKQEHLQNVLEKISTEMNFKDKIVTPFEEIKVTNFYGVYSGQLPIKTSGDEIRILTNDIIKNCIVYNYDTKKEENVYNLDKLNSYDKYDIYLSGATSLLTIENPDSVTDNELVVFRDSFGSSLIPLFSEAYKKITVVDIRYINSAILGDYIDFTNKDILFLYSTLVINNSGTLK